MLRDLRLKRNVSLSFLLLCFLGSLQLTFAEGSKDWYPADYNHSGAGEFRACLYSGVPSAQDPNSALPFPTNATMKVYAKAGEHIYIASSLLADASASIVWRAPDGSTGTWTNAQAKNNSDRGIIADREAELAGPNLPGETSGYNAYKLTVAPDQEGVWEIDFQTTKTLNFPDESTQSSDIKVTAWKNLSDKVPFIMAFDISVSNVDDNAFISGRVYANILNVVVPNYLDKNHTKYATEWYTKYYVLTNTTYLYEVNPNGQNGHYSTFFANNKGVQENYTETFQYASSNGTAAVVSKAISVKGGIASYESYHFGANTFPNSFVPLYDPRSPDNVKKVLNADGEYEDYYEDVTHKIFFNKPDRTMPAKAKCVYGNTVGETWLITKLNEKDTPELSNLTIAGKESNLPGVLGPEGVNIYFEANVAGEYVIDMSFGDSYVNRQFTGVCVAGPNVIEWDGKDGDGTTVPMTDISLSGKLRSAEIHFPYCDLENNKNGISLLQLNAAWTDVARKKIYWDDSTIGGNTSGADGKDSPEHKYAYDGSSIGDQSIIDTWTYAEGESQGVQHCQAKSRYIDLAIDSIACDKKVAHIGEPITYTLKVKNIYHENYDFQGMSVTCDADADSASVGIWFPEGGFYTDSVFLVSSSDPNCKVVQQPSGDEYSLGFINLTNGDSAIVKVVGYAGSKLAHKEIQAEGFIMRPGDYYEVDANNINDDGMPLLPVDTVAGGNKGEYDGIPNNNLITAPEILFFLNSAPDATPDTVNVDACNTVEGSLLDNDFEIDADPMTITKYYIGENGSSVTPGTTTSVDPYGDITINADGTYSFSATNVAGSLPNIYYIVSDGFEGITNHEVGDLIPGIDTSFMMISIKQNQLPSIAPTSATIQAGTKVEVPISFTDPENDALTITKSGTDAAKFSIENGKLYYTGGSIDNTTTYTFNVSVSDGCNDPVVEEVSVTVKADHAPDASDVNVCIQVKSGTKKTSSFLLPIAFDDVDGDKVEVKITAQKIDKTNVTYFSVDKNNGNLYYTPNNDDNSTKKSGVKTYTVNVTITSNGVTTAKTITVKVNVDKNDNGTTPTFSVTGKTVLYGTTLGNAYTYTATPNSSDIFIKDGNLKCYHNDDVLPVGTYNLTFTYANNSCTSPYYFGKTATATIKVEPLPITLTSATDEREYDGNPLENHTVTPSTALVGDDAFTYTNFASQTEVGETDNTFDVLPVGGTDLNNYVITKSYGTLTVTPVDLDADDFEIDASSKTVTYDKNAKELDFTATISASDYDVYYKVEGVWTTTKPVVVGEYPAKVHVTGANYVNEDITSDDWKLIIEPKMVTLNWSPSNTFVYDGTEKTVTPSVNGVIEGDVCNVTGVTGNQATNVGAYSAEVAGLSNDNYTLSSSSFSWNITSKTINPFIPTTPKDEDYKVTITGEGSFVYDATAKTPVVTVKVGDKVIPSTEYTVTYANNIDAGENTAEITIANATGGNYTVEGTTIYFSIAPAPLTLTSENGTFTYNGTAHKKDVVTVTSGQLYGTDALTYSNFTEQTDVDTVPNKFAYAASGSTKLSNYTIDTLCGNLMVTPASMTLTCPTGSAVTKAYDGAALNPKATVSNTYGDDVIAISYSIDNGTSWSTTAPSITNVAESPLTVKVKAENANYKTETCSYELSISKALLKIEITDSKEYDGSVLVSDYSKATATGLVSGDALTAGSFTTTGVNVDDYESDGVDFTKTAISTTFATTKGIENYDVTYDVKQSITTVTTPIIIKASDDEKKYDGTALTNAGFTYTEGVLKSGDVLTAVVDGTITDAGSVANVVTSYQVMRGTDDVTANYTFGASKNGTLTVTKRNVTLTSSNAEKV
ncbi:MAG: Ig-like domain-containing protein, partial [Paludibacteraceae bacterium]|nr:Ig-like domain-containing protein [Paludibacteraceae bacterium]